LQSDKKICQKNHSGSGEYERKIDIDGADIFLAASCFLPEAIIGRGIVYYFDN